MKQKIKCYTICEYCKCISWWACLYKSIFLDKTLKYYISRNSDGCAECDNINCSFKEIELDKKDIELIKLLYFKD